MTTSSHHSSKTAEKRTSEEIALRGGRQVHRQHQKRIHRDPSLRKRSLPPVEAIPYAESVLLSLDRMRFLTNEQIGELVFRRTATKFGRERSDRWRQYQKSANLAIGDLMDHHLIEKLRMFQTHRQTGTLFQSTVNILTAAGRNRVKAMHERDDHGRELRATSDLRQYADRKIDHELEINDVAIALMRAVWHLDPESDVLDWRDDDLLKRDRRQQFRTFVPDGWCMVEAPGGRYCPLFIEVDRGTESVRSRTGSEHDWFSKMINYGEYFRDRYGDDPLLHDLGLEPGWQAQPLVLTVTTSAERLDNMVAATVAAGGRTTYWFTTRHALYGNPDFSKGETWAFAAALDPIWRRAGAPGLVSLRDHLLGNVPLAPPLATPLSSEPVRIL